MVARRVPQVPMAEIRRIARPVTRTDNDLAEMHAKLERVAKRDRDANRRVRIHVLLVSSGLVISVALSFVPALPPVVHFGPMVSGMPAIVQELLDWIRGW